MTAAQPRVRSRLLAAANLGQAAVLLAQPPQLLESIAGDESVPPAWIMRVLGGRILLQAAAQAIRPTRGLLRLGLAVDATHAVSMLLAARIWPRYRRAALASSAGAATSAVAAAVIVRTSR